MNHSFQFKFKFSICLIFCFCFIFLHHSRAQISGPLIDGSTLTDQDIPMDPIKLKEKETVIDRFGKVYSYDELIDMQGKSKNKNDCVNSSFYDVTLSGNFTQDEETTICNVFNYLGSVIENPDNNTVFITVVKTSLAQGVGATGTPLFTPDDLCGVRVNPIWNKIYNDISISSISQGLISINSNIHHQQWYHNIQGGTIESDKIDMFTVVLHEAMHAHGFASEIVADGSARVGFYSVWDSYLISGNGDPVLIPPIETEECCDELIFNGTAFPPQPDQLWVTSCGSTPIINFDDPAVAEVGGNYDPASFNSADDYVANVLSHVCNQDAVMYFEIPLGPDGQKQALTGPELEILCHLGYEINACTQDVPCMVVANDDYFSFLHPTGNIFIDYNGNGTDVGIFDNDLGGPYFNFNSYVVSDCGDDDYLDITELNSSLRISNYQDGLNVICYEIEGCDGQCDQGYIYVEIIPDVFECPFTNECDQILCHGDFENFDNFLGVWYDTEGIDNFEYCCDNNTPNITDGLTCGSTNTWCGSPGEYCSSSSSIIPPMPVTGGERYVQLKSGEGFYIPLNSSLVPGSTYAIDFSVYHGCINELYFAFTDALPCSKIFGPSMGPVLYNATTTTLECNTGYTLNVIDIISTTIGQTDDNNDGEIEWVNRSVNYTALGGEGYLIVYRAGVIVDPSNSMLLDNINMTGPAQSEITIESTVISACLGGDAIIDYEICKENINENIDIDLEASLPNVPGLSFSTEGDFDLNGMTSVNIPPGTMCVTVQLVLNIDLSVPLGTEFNVDLIASTSDGCVNSENGNNTLVTVEDGNAPPSSGFDFDINPCPTVQFTSFEDEPGTTHSWDFGDSNTSTQPNPSHTYPNTMTSYTVVHCVTNDCGTDCTDLIITIDCNNELDCLCTDPGSIAIDGGNLTDSSLPPDQYDNTNMCISISGEFTIDEDYLITGGEIKMNPGATIIVPAGIEFSLNGVHIYGCVQMWNGIQVLSVAGSEAKLYMENCIIEDAFKAVQVENRSTLKLLNNVFDANHIGVEALLYNGGPQYMNTEISNNTFQCTSDLIDPAPGMDLLNSTGCSYMGIHILYGASFVVGGNWSNSQPNYFTNQEIGVTFDKCFNVRLHMAKMEGYEGSIGVILDNSDKVLVEESNLFDMSTGIRTHNTNSILKENFIGVIENGIEVNTTNGKGCSIHKNNITAGLYCLAFLNSHPSILDEDHHVSGHHLTATNPDGAGIYFEDFHCELSISGNKIKSDANSLSSDETHRGTGILGLNSGNLAKEGIIKIGPGTNEIDYDVNINAIGISVTNTDGVRIEYNNINRATSSQNISTAIRLNEFRNGLIHCNDVDKSTIGVEFIGDCSNTAIWSTDFFDHDIALNYFYATVGVQEFHKNDWREFASQRPTDAQITDDNLAALADNHYKTPALLIPDGYSPGNIVVNVPGGNDTDWFTIEGNTYGGCGVEYMNISGFDNSAIATAISEYDGGPVNIGRLATRKSNLYQHLRENGNQLGLDASIDAFYSEMNNSDHGELVKLTSSLQTFKNTSGSARVELQNKYESLLEIIGALDEINAKIGSAFNPGNEDLKTKKQAFLNSLNELVTDIEAVESLDKLRIKGMANYLSVQNDQVISQLVSSSNLQKINSIILAQIVHEKSEYDQNERLIIDEIAAQCPFSGGLAVYVARGMQRTYNIINYDDESLCFNASKTSSTLEEGTLDITNMASDILKVYPNPVTDIINVQLIKELKSAKYSLELIDITGKSTLRQWVDNRKTVSMDITTLTNGLYILVLRDIQGNVLESKRIVIH